MDFNQLTLKVKEEFPDKAIDISESLGLLKETISDTIDAISQKVSVAMSDRDFDQLTIYSDMAKAANEYELKIDDLMSLLDVDELEVEVEEKIEEEGEKQTIKNYGDYVVSHDVEHTLYENFTHKRPYAFKVNNENIIEVNTWHDMFIKTCQYLYAVNHQKFLNFANVASMNGKKKKYFATDSKELRKAGQVASNAFVETNQSANGIRNLIIKMLKQYGFKTSEYKVFFRADYSTME